MKKKEKKSFKNILFITHCLPLWNLDSGGIGMFTYNLAKQLNSMGVKVYILGFSKNINMKKEVIIDNIYTSVYPYIKFPFFSEYLNRIIFNFFTLYFIIVNRIQIIEAPSYLGLIWPIKTLSPLIIRLHSSSLLNYLENNKAEKIAPRIKFELNIIKNADVVVSVSNYLKEGVLDFFPKVNNINVIYNGINRDIFKMAHKKMSKSNILFVGNISAEKGLINLLEAWEIVIRKKQKFKLNFIGPYKSEFLKKYFDKYGRSFKETVQFRGPVKNHELVSYYQEATVVVIPSHFEANPLVLLEAMSCGCAVICPNHTGFSEIIIDGENGIFCDTKNAEEFANQIIRLLDNDKLRNEIGLNAEKYISKKFDHRVTLKSNIDLYQNVIDGC